MPYEVIVNDNFHYMDPEETYKAAEYEDAAAAVEHCRGIVDQYLDATFKPGMTAAELWDSYTSFGEDPAIACVGVDRVKFSAWDYARERCKTLCGGL